MVDINQWFRDRMKSSNGAHEAPSFNSNLAEFTSVDLTNAKPYDHPNMSNDVTWMGGGTPGRMMKLLYRGAVEQGLDKTSLLQIRSAGTAREDTADIRLIELNRDKWIAGDGGPPDTAWYYPNSPLVGGYVLGRGIVTALASNPLEAVRLMLDNKLIRKEVRETIANDMLNALHAHGKTGGITVTITGFSGNEPLIRGALQAFASQTVEHVRVSARILPSRSYEESLQLGNAKGELFRILINGLPANELVILTQNQTRGSQPNDDCFVFGIASLTGTSRSNREQDGRNLTRTILQYGCGFVDSTPVPIEIPLAPRSEKTGKHDENYYLVHLPERLGGRAIEQIASSLRHTIDRNPDALNVVSIPGFFPDEQEAVDLKDMLSSIPGRSVIPVVNTLEKPTIHDSSIRYPANVFAVAQHLPRSIVSLYEDTKGRFSLKDGLTPAQFLAGTRPPVEFAEAQQVAELLDQLI